MEQVKDSRSSRAPHRYAASIRHYLIFAFCLGGLSLEYPAQAAPLVESRVGGLSLVGAASPHLASAHYNPATLELVSGHRVFFDGTVRLTSGRITRYWASPTTGETDLQNRYQPETFLETFPQFFLGGASTLGSDSIVLALFATTPVAQRISLQRGDGLTSDTTGLRSRDSESAAEVRDRLFDPAEQGPARYQMVDLTLYHVYVTAAASYEVIRELIIGASVSYVHGSLDLGFVRDAALEGGSRRDGSDLIALDQCGQSSGSVQPCGYENDAAAEAIRTRGVSHSLGFAVGVLVRPHPDLSLGLSYVSEVMGFGGDDIPAKGDAWVLRSEATMAAWTGNTIARDAAGRSVVSYRLPDAVNLGIHWRATDWLAVNGQFRWLNYSVHQGFSARLTGTEFRESPRLPDRVVLYRGFKDVFAVQLGTRVWLPWGFDLQFAAMLETAALDKEAITVAAIDATKVDLFASLGWSFAESFRLQLGYGLVAMAEQEVQESVFAGPQMVRCVDNRYNVDLAACTAAEAGKGSASAAGQYFSMSHRIGLSFSYVYR